MMEVGEDSYHIDISYLSREIARIPIHTGFPGGSDGKGFANNAGDLG